MYVSTNDLLIVIGAIILVANLTDDGKFIMLIAFLLYVALHYFVKVIT